ncbi:Imm52 family immunity protein [Archangium sp.]|uniref:Imm52 family immunity protein n=1 Tax=Archangium sp. TaxID=1872627 RepID=UPI00389A13F2
MQEEPEDYYVGAYWGPRKETALECARRTELFLHMLTRCDPSFTQWYHAGRGFPRELPGWPVHPEVAELEKLLLKGRHRTDVGKKVIEDMGFGRMMWNAKEEATNLDLFCGAYSPWSSPNYCLLKPPRQGAVRERLLCEPVLTEVLTSMATAWDPDYAMASSSEMVDQVEKEGGEVRVGWLTYLSRRLGTLPPLPAPVRIEPVGALGWLLTLSPEPMTASNPEHVAFTVRVRELLDRAGLIARPKAEPLGT